MSNNHNKCLRNESGVILVTVVVMSVALMVFTIALVSMSSSQALSSQHQIDRIKAEQFAKGAFWYNYMNLTATGTPAMPPTETLDRKTFTPALNATAAAGPNSTDQYDIRIAY